MFQWISQMKQRSHWGWGYEGVSIDPEELTAWRQLITTTLGVDLPVGLSPPLRPPTVEDIPIRPSRIDKQIPLPHSVSPRERLTHSYGKGYRDIVRGLQGDYPNPPDAVVFPTCTKDIQILFQFCEDNGVACVPYGGGSSVVGGVEFRDDSGRPWVSCDLRQMCKLLSVDKVSRTATIQAGAYGPHIERQLRSYGFTLRHFPQSFEFSTLGGWIATRAGGHFVTVYTHIDDLVVSTTTVTPCGVIGPTRSVPASGAGPLPNQLILGSEGTLGIITEATVRVFPVPRYKSEAIIFFPSFEDGSEAVREIVQSHFYPTNCRLVSALEGVSMGIGDGACATLLLAFESHSTHSKVGRAADLVECLTICRKRGGKVSTEGASVAEKWKKMFLRVPYIRDHFVAYGMILETFETAVSWAGVKALIETVHRAAHEAFDKLGIKGVIFHRYTHVYPNGPAPYFTIAALSHNIKRATAEWDSIKKHVSDALMLSGATITHHHAVGRDHMPWYRAHEIGGDPTAFQEALAAMKKKLDPCGILNPGVLVASKL